MLPYTTFVICRQSHKRLLEDSRTFDGTLLDSDHRLLTAKVDLTQLYNVWGRIEKVRTSKRVRYNTSLLANEPYRAKFCDAVSEGFPEINTNASASERWSSVENIVKEAAESTIGLTALTGRRDTPHCPEMAAMSAEQRKLKLWRQNTRDVNNKAILKLQRNAILHAMRRKARWNTEERLDRMASEVERLLEGAKMFRAVREMTRRPATQQRSTTTPDASFPTLPKLIRVSRTTSADSSRTQPWTD